VAVFRYLGLSSFLPLPFRGIVVMRKLRALIFMMLALTACGEDAPSDSPPKRPQSASCRSISAEDKAVLLANVAKLEIGDPQTKVQLLLGKPSDIDHGQAKPSGQVTSTDYIYLVKKCAYGPHIGWDDDFVRLTFDTDGRLELVQGIRVQGVTTRSVPLVR
jgi:hypothetical protein